MLPLPTAVRAADGRLIGDLFDGEGFVRGVQRKGLVLKGASALVVGSGGVGSAIAASLAAAGVAPRIMGFGPAPAVRKVLAQGFRTGTGAWLLVLSDAQRLALALGDVDGGDLAVEAPGRNGGCRMTGQTRWCRVSRPDGSASGWAAGRFLIEAGN